MNKSKKNGIIHIIGRCVRMQEFEVIIDGEKKTAQIVSRLELEKTGIEYIYYYIDDEIDQNGDNYWFFI